jgi:3-phosphoshikimate 1-carboxyvinyltransferase
MSDRIRLRPATPFCVELRPPGSKSITNRALLLAAVARGRSALDGWLDADDTRHMRACLTALGVDNHVERSTAASSEVLVVEGSAGPIAAAAAPPVLFVGTAGTVARFLLAVLAASPGRARLDGTPRMRERPMAALVDALRAQGAAIACPMVEGALPMDVGPHASLLTGGELRLSRPASSQFVSGLVIAGALAARPTRIVLEQGTPARPYIDMTLAVLEAFGGRAGWSARDVLEVEPRMLEGRTYVIEPDASAASYPLALAAIAGGRTTIPDLGRASMQGDVGFADVLARLGADVRQDATSTTVEGGKRLRGGSFDLSDMPDMTLTLAVTALYAEGPTRITGVGILRHHESDRLAASATQLRKLGAEVTEEPEGLVIEPPPGGPRRGVEIETYDDHRMAMAFALAGEVTILDPGCVAKTYPEYFNDLAKLGMVVS